MNRSARRLEVLLPLTLMASVGAVLLLVSGARFMGVDEGVWNYMGRMWVHGQPVYQATMDNKPPGIFMVYALSHALAGPGVFLPRLLGVLAMTATVGGVYWLAKRMHSLTAGVLAATMFGLAMGWEVMDGPFAAQTESFMVLPIVLAFLALWRAAAGTSGGRMSWIVLGGLLIGFAISFKQTAVLSALAWPIVHLALTRRAGQLTRLRAWAIAGELATYSLGVLAGITAFVLPVLACGVEFKDYWFGTWLLPLLPGTGNGNFDDRLAKTFQIWCETSLTLFYLPLAAFILRSRTLRAGGLPVVALLAWATLEFVAAGSSGFWYGHQIKQVALVLALLGGVGLASAIQAIRAPGVRTAILTAAVTAVVLAWLPWSMMRRAMAPRQPDPDQSMGQYVRDHSADSDYVLALDWRGFQILAWSDRSSPCRWFNSFFLKLHTCDLARDPVDELAIGLRLHPPRYILLPTWWENEPWPNYMRSLQRHYKRTHSDGQYEVLERTK